jgi:lipopolysaccharide O-acetyltransferase
MQENDADRRSIGPSQPEWIQLQRATGVRKLRTGLWRRIRVVLHALRWKPRFAAFGWGSTLVAPALLTQPGRIAIGQGVEIRGGARIEALPNARASSPTIEIGDRSSIHLHVHIGAAIHVKIGRSVLIAGNVYITDHDHRLPDPNEPELGSGRVLAAPTSIGDECWLGEGATILKGVQLGRGCAVGAGAVVTRSFPDYSLLVGVPARRVRRYDVDAGRWVPCPRSGPDPER